MKTQFYFLFLLLFTSSTLAMAKVIRVDNNTGASADYVKLQDAINNANPGDSIYVVGSPKYYDTDERGSVAEIRLNKKVIIIGPGYFLGENENTQFNKQIAKLRYMNIGEGANESIVTGLFFENAITINLERLDGSRGSNEPKNVTITRNFIYYMYIYNGSNLLISQNFSNYRGSAIYLNGSTSGTIIRNNIFISNSSSIYGDYNASLANTVITNNTLNGGIYRINGANIQNNIFITGSISDSRDNNVKNNLFTTTEEAVFPENSTGNDASDNIFSAVQANLFISPEPSIDSHFRLADESPARDQGIEGQDLGAFGGTDPYRLSGLPAIPAIYELTTSGVGTPTEGMSVTIKASSHN